MSKITFKELVVEHIVKPRLKHSYISVHKDLKILIKTPRVSNAFVHDLLIEKEAWIRKQILKIENNPPLKVSLEDEILLFGEIYSIDSNEASDLRLILSNINTENQKKVTKAYDDFYIKLSQKHLLQRLEHYSSLMSLEYSSVKFKKLKSRWGSCDSNRVITLNSRLMQVKTELIDYVIVHELSHLVHMNHSKAFHSFVDRYISDSKAKRAQLRSLSIL